MGETMQKKIMLFLLSFILIYPNFVHSKIYDINKKYVALSFDDGPSEYTNKIVEYLHDNNSTATFFIVGNKAAKYQNTLINVVNKGNEIANHTYSHPWLSKLNNKEIISEINKTQEIINKITGKLPTLFRPSYGYINNELKKLINLDIIMWTTDSSDWKYKNSKTIASNVIRNIKEFDIILMHDTYKRSLEALKIIIPKLKDMGYEIVSVSELLTIKDLYELQKY